MQLAIALHAPLLACSFTGGGTADLEPPRKKPDEGRMKGLAFALDPDGYWVELLRGGAPGRHTLAQTMLRVKDGIGLSIS